MRKRNAEQATLGSSPHGAGPCRRLIMTRRSSAAVWSIGVNISLNLTTVILASRLVAPGIRVPEREALQA